VGEGLGFSELRRVDPPAPLLLLMCAARRGPTTIGWLTPPIRARDQAGQRPVSGRWTPVGVNPTEWRRSESVAQTIDCRDRQDGASEGSASVPALSLIPMAWQCGMGGQSLLCSPMASPTPPRIAAAQSMSRREVHQPFLV
jgi:hypothetical protein